MRATMDERDCQGCGMHIGAGYVETQSYQVGGYQICGWCSRELKHRGRLQVEPYNQHLYLYPDGEVLGGRVFVVDEKDD